MKKTIIIAEAGVNHNGSLAMAFKLIDYASEAGADYVKFQTFNASKLVSAVAPKAEYQAKNTATEVTGQQEMLEKLTLTQDDFRALYDYCQTRKIGFLSTGFDSDSVLFIDRLGVDYHKIPSGEITNLPYLRLIGSLGKPVILSTGMATLEEIRVALDVLYEQGITDNRLTILHCTTEYPAPFTEVNLNAIQSIRNAFGIKTGYSDHTAGIEIPVAAVALGAVMIEKHFTSDRNLPGPDHKASLEPNELAAMVRSIRNVEMSFGDGIKKPSPSEIKNIPIARRSIHLAENLPAGHVLKESDLVMKRPGNGISPMLMDKVIGKTLKTNLDKDTLLTWENLL
ncbi:MAG: N-acetylneuraminate synthase [Bacteroidales bacterium]|nr:N-acetylneuraminate synthase [Bacteroidales bacterium]